MPQVGTGEREGISARQGIARTTGPQELAQYWCINVDANANLC